MQSGDELTPASWARTPVQRPPRRAEDRRTGGVLEHVGDLDTGDPFWHLHWRAVCEVQEAAANHIDLGCVGVKRMPSSANDTSPPRTPNLSVASSGRATR